MTIVIAELYDALLAAGTPEPQARKAADVKLYHRMRRTEPRLGEVRPRPDHKRYSDTLTRDAQTLKADFWLMRRMTELLLLFTAATWVKVFLMS